MSIFTVAKEEVKCSSYEITPELEEVSAAMDETSSSLIRVSPEIVTALQTNSRISYNKLSRTINKDNFSFDRSICKNRVITFKDAVVSVRGHIITSKSIYYNGGCVKKDRPFAPREISQIFSQSKAICPSYKKAVSIAALWTWGVWHFPMEALVALKCITNFEDVHLHISKKNDLCMGWLKLIGVDIPEDRIVDGRIHAQELIFPEMGGCGNPYYNQVVWLRQRVLKTLGNAAKPNDLFILIKRSARRSVKNHDTYEELCKTFCNKHGLTFWLHDDLLLPSLQGQMKIFNRAKIVMGPHGGGGVNLIATRPGAYFVEFLMTTDINICYTRFAEFLDINYIGLPYGNAGIDVDKHITPTFSSLTRMLAAEKDRASV